ncbi:hypothetical protein N431DRAFT_400024 [Stipitochalara longipes BDJ]|nr:hypothetical protein N431DRAFT_400024 [Stipitochalara longipes BDJ]
MERRRIATSSSPTSSSTSESDGLLTPQSDTVSISSATLANIQFQDLAQQVRTIRLSQDVPLPSIERSSSSSSGGVPISRNIGHSRTPSVSQTSPRPSSSEDLRASPASRLTNNSIDGRLGMSEVAAALESVGRDSIGPSAFLRPETTAVGSSPSPRQSSRRRSTPRTSVATHDVRDEELPNDRFHETTFQQAFSDSKRLMEELTEVLSSSTIQHDQDSVMRRLHEKGSELARFHCPSTRTVGFVGDSGVGKSSLLNTLLDFRALARTSDGGAACTSVITEYHYHSADDFTIEVEWFSTDETVAQLTELLRAYRYYHIYGTDTEGDESNDVRDRAKVAKDIFQAMFRGRLGDDEGLIRWPEKRILKIFRSWVARANRSPSGRQTYNSLEDCSSHLMQLTSEQIGTQEPAKWPYIREVRVFLKAHILSKGLVLVDLPGLRDLNSARQSITERHLLKCDEIFAVCCIGRATTDASVMSVFEIAARAELSNVGIVCTKSGDIRPDEAKRDWGGEKARAIQGHQDAIARDRRDLEDAEAEAEYWSEAEELDPAEQHRLIRREKEVKRRLKSHQLELEHYLITTRNSSVTSALERTYREKLPGNNLRVFCVDNIMYQEHRSAPKDAALPFLRLSGILAVRKHCIAMVASNQLRSALKYINDDIPALLGDIQLWVQSGAGTLDAERRMEIREVLNVLETRLKRNLTGNASHINRIERSSMDMFRELITRRQLIAYWTTDAARASDVWAGWYHSTYSAFCRNYGYHETGAVGRHNWNSDAIEQMVRDLATPWLELRSQLLISLERESQSIKDLMDDSMEYTDNQLEHSLELADTLGETMRSRQHLLLADIEQACENFETELSLLRTDAFSGLRTSFIGELMKESYEECNRDYGPGSDRRRKRVIGDRLSDEEVFISLQRIFKDQFSKLAEKLQINIKAAILTHLSVITNTLDIVRSENAVIESERDPAFRHRVGREVRAVIHEVRRLQGVMGSSALGDHRRVGVEV